LCGAVDAWDQRQVTELAGAFPRLLRIRYLANSRPGRTAADLHDVLVDRAGEAFARLGIERAAQYLVRPDGHIGFRCGGTSVAAVTQYLDRWFHS
jgi:hypothetical protein